MGIPDGYDVIRDVTMSFWNPREEIRVCQLVSLGGIRDSYSLSGFFAEWLATFGDSPAKDHQIRESYDQHVDFLQKISIGDHSDVDKEIKILRDNRFTLRQPSDGGGWIDERILSVGYKMIDYVGGASCNTQSIYSILQDSLDTTGRRIYPMAEMTDKFMTILLKHFPEPPPLP